MTYEELITSGNQGSVTELAISQEVNDEIDVPDLQTYNGGVRYGAPAKLNKRRVCVISCSSMDRNAAAGLRTSRWTIAVKHGDKKRWRGQKCPVCGKRAELVFQVME